ncbi:hypothetical protein DFH27DRAFT_590743 [Peziza echinospora]|nr:hypothetical protein DFH27DRAFT_590743 [Peziza echinospora]
MASVKQSRVQPPAIPKPTAINNVAFPAVHPLNTPPSRPPLAPLFIGFTRNFGILQQSIASYIAAGFPTSQIHIVDNTGTMDSNAHGKLSPENPFYLPYPLLVNTYGVNVITTPALLTFSQLQNFYIATALSRGWDKFLWSHMDAVVVSYEDRRPYKSLYQMILEVLEKVGQETKAGRQWGLRFFSYDRLTLVNVPAVIKVGGWDTMIPFYYSDCDFYERVRMNGYAIDDEEVGHVFDVGGVIPDLAMFFPSWSGESIATSQDALKGLDSHVPPLTPQHFILLEQLTNLMAAKNTAEDGRNFWQLEQKGGKGEPFYRPAKVFDAEIARLIELGQDVFGRKWGFEKGKERCDLTVAGKGLDDAWKGLE